MESNNLNERLFFLTVLSGKMSEEQIIEKAIKNTINRGLKQFNTFIFTSCFTTDEINKTIEAADKNLNFFLIDMTDHLDRDVFKGSLCKGQVVYAKELMEILKDFKKPSINKEKQQLDFENSLSKEKRADYLLDQISQKGKDSLTAEQLNFLKNF